MLVGAQADWPVHDEVLVVQLLLLLLLLEVEVLRRQCSRFHRIGRSRNVDFRPNHFSVSLPIRLIWSNQANPISCCFRAIVSQSSNWHRRKSPTRRQTTTFLVVVADRSEKETEFVFVKHSTFWPTFFFHFGLKVLDRQQDFWDRFCQNIFSCFKPFLVSSSSRISSSRGRRQIFLSLSLLNEREEICFWRPCEPKLNLQWRRRRLRRRWRQRQRPTLPQRRIRRELTLEKGEKLFHPPFLFLTHPAASLSSSLPRSLTLSLTFSHAHKKSTFCFFPSLLNLISHPSPIFSLSFFLAALVAICSLPLGFLPQPLLQGDSHTCVRTRTHTRTPTRAHTKHALKYRHKIFAHPCASKASVNAQATLLRREEESNRSAVRERGLYRRRRSRALALKRGGCKNVLSWCCYTRFTKSSSLKQKNITFLTLLLS